MGRAKRVMDASARPALAQTLEMEVSAQEYLMAEARARATAEAQSAPQAGETRRPEPAEAFTRG